MLHHEITNLLRDELAPATGCTGPTAYALAAAACRAYVTGDIRHFRVYVSPAYLKIGFGVATPGTSTPGIEIAAAAGFVAGDPARGMQVLQPVTAADLERAHSLCAQGRLSVHSAPEQKGVYVRCEIETSRETVVSVVSHTHDGLCLVQVNGADVFRADPSALPDRIEDHPDSLSLSDIFQYARTCTLDETGFLLEGYRINRALAEDGIRGAYGLGTGRALLLRALDRQPAPSDLLQDPLHDLPASIEMQSLILVCGACDGRMGGSRLPAMAAMGDGNQGLTLLLPLGVAGHALGKSDLETARAMALGALILFYIKMRIGRASAMCLCALASAAGVAAGYGALRGLSERQIEGAVKNVLSPLAGMLCDGAKNACALKMSVAVSTALRAVDWAALDVQPGYYDGLCDDSLEQTVHIITQVTNQTMEMLDLCMVNAILHKAPPDAQQGKEMDRP